MRYIIETLALAFSVMVFMSAGYYMGMVDTKSTQIHRCQK